MFTAETDIAIETTVGDRWNVSRCVGSSTDQTHRDSPPELTALFYTTLVWCVCGHRLLIEAS